MSPVMLFVFMRKKPSGDELLDVRRVRLRERAGVGYFAKSAGGLVHVHVGRLRGEDGRDDQLERIHVTSQ